MTDRVAELTGAEQIAWELRDLYQDSNDPTLVRDMDAAAARADELDKRYRGRVASLSVAELLSALREYESIDEQMSKVHVFAYLQWTTNTNEGTYGALLQKVTERAAKLSQKLVFFALEWASVPDEQAARLIADPALARYQHYLEAERRYRPHLLSEPEEKILSEKNVTGRASWVRFFDETLGAARYDYEGEKLPLEPVLKRLYEPDRETRRKAAASVTGGLKQTLRPLTFIFNTVLADKASDDSLRKYPNWVSARNLANEASDETVQALIEAVTSRYDLVSRYYDLKRKLLGLDTLYEYDRYAPLPTKTSTHYQWTEARDTVLRAYEKFDPRMAEIGALFFEKRWIDAPVRPGKRGGAFSHPNVPSSHPYILMNFVGSARDVSTLAHELGHGIHQYLSRQHGMLQAGTPLTTAEMASTFGEMLVFNDLMAREPDPNARLAMIAGKVEDIFATVFRQISMNRFEDALHTARRTEGELSSDRISTLWMETQRAMFRNSVTLTDDYSVWWSYVSHFLHVPGYVYAYSFGELLVLALFARYQQEGASFASKYIEVLSAGGSDWPHAILSKLGVDLNDPGFWKLGLAEIEKLVTQAEALTAK